jgi:hypothetical protein
MRRTLAAAALLLAALAPGLAAQRTQWTDAVYVPGRWQAGRLLRVASRNGATDSLALVMRVDYFSNPPRWRAEVRRSADGRTFGAPEIIIGNGAAAQVVTQLGATPFEQHALARDTLVRAAVGALDASGRRRGAASGRIAEKLASGVVGRVVFRRAQRAPTFSDELLNPGGSAGGRALLASGIHQVGDQRSASVVATAGARGVDNVQTPRGNVPVHPDTMAVVRMERFSVGSLRLEEFLRAGHLGAYGSREGGPQP